MNVTASLARDPAAGSGWLPAASVCALATAALLLLFRTDVVDLAHIYWTSSNYGHCLFVLPIVGWLAWQRRAGLQRIAPQPWWPGLLAVAAGALMWLVGAAAGAGILRHLALVTMAQGVVLSVLGPVVTRALLFPLAYLWFLVPFGDSFQAPLQQLTAELAMGLLHAFGIPAVSDGVLITTTAGYFEVAEACSGAGFVIAMIAFATLAAHVGFLSWTRRAIFFAFAIVVPILANGVRAFSTIVAAHLTSIEAATGFDHIVYGWFFFAFVIALVIAAAWRWFDRDPSAPWVDVERLRHRVPFAATPLQAGAAAIALMLAAIGWNAAIAGRADPLPPAIATPEVPGWNLVPKSVRADWSPTFDGADRLLHVRYADGAGVPVDLVIAVYASQGEGRELVGFGQGAIGEDSPWIWVEDTAPIGGARVIRMTAPGPVERTTATWYRVGDVLTGSETRVKIETLKAKLLGGRQAGAAVLISAEAVPGSDPRATLERFVAALGPVDRIADTAAGR